MSSHQESSFPTYATRKVRGVDEKFVDLVRSALRESELPEREFAKMVGLSSFQLRNLFARVKKKGKRKKKPKKSFSKSKASFVPIEVKPKHLVTASGSFVVSGFWVSISCLEDVATLLSRLERDHAHP